MQYEYKNELERNIEMNITRFISKIRVKYCKMKSAPNSKLAQFTKVYISMAKFQQDCVNYQYFGFDYRHNQLVFVSKLWSNPYRYLCIEIEMDNNINKEVVYGRQKEN